MAAVKKVGTKPSGSGLAKIAAAIDADLAKRGIKKGSKSYASEYKKASQKVRRVGKGMSEGEPPLRSRAYMDAVKGRDRSGSANEDARRRRQYGLGKG